MFRVVTALLALVSLTSNAVAQPVTVTFWNIQWFPGRRPNATRAEEERQIREVHSDLAQIQTDILAMEEVRDWQHAALAVQPWPDFHLDVCSTFPPREGQTDTQQVAVASRLQPLSAWSELWQSRGPVTPPRGFDFAAYQLAPRQLLLVYALHLKSNRGEVHEDMRLREESMRQLTAHIDAMNAAYSKLGDITWIIGGDFNTAPDEPRFTSEKTVPLLLAQNFRWVWEGMPFSERITLPADKRFPAACFDQIFYRNAKLVRAWVTPTSVHSSDHRAISATFKVGR